MIFEKVEFVFADLEKKEIKQGVSLIDVQTERALGLASGTYRDRPGVLSFLGKESFSIIIVHMLVLFTINGFLFVYLDSLNINHVLNIAVNFLVFTALSLVFSKLFSMALTPLTNKLCNYVWSKIGKKD